MQTRKAYRSFTAGGRRLSRRRLVQTGAVGGAGLLLAACSGDSNDSGSAQSSGASPTTEAAVETPRHGGVLRTATIVQAPHFSPFHPGADPSAINTWRRANGYYDTLWTFKAVNVPDRLVPRVAQSIEQPDESTYVVTLHRAAFHNRPPANGREVTAEDIVATIQFLMKPPATGGGFIQSGKDLKSVTAVDPSTVRFETLGPRAFFYEEALGPVGSAGNFVPREMLDEKTLKEQIPVGSGPYEYKMHTLGSIEEAKRFDGYRLTPRPYIDEKKIVFMPDSAAIEAAFRAGQIDTTTFTNSTQRDGVKRDLGDRIQTRSETSASGVALMVNVNRAPWNDVRVREAIYRAVDVDRIINIVWLGDGERTWYFSPARTTRNPLPWSAVQQWAGPDPKRAAELLKQAGIDPNTEYDLMVSTESQESVDLARLAIEDLQKVGLKMRLNPVPRNIQLQRAGPKPGDFDMTISVLLDYNYAQTKSGTFWDSSSLQDPEVDALVEKIQRTIDVPERDKLSEEFQYMLARKYSNLIPLLATITHNGWYSYYKGLDFDAGAWQDNVWLDKS